MESEICRWVTSDCEILWDQGPFSQARAEEVKASWEAAFAKFVDRGLPQWHASIEIRVDMAEGLQKLFLVWYPNWRRGIKVYGDESRKALFAMYAPALLNRFEGAE